MRGGAGGDKIGSPNLLDIGIGIWNGLGSSVHWDHAATYAVDQALDSTDRTYPAKTVVLLATADWCCIEKSLSEFVLGRIKQRLGYSIPLIGGSMPRIFVSQPQAEAAGFTRIEHGFVVILLFSDDLWVTVGKFERPYDYSADERSRKLRALVAHMKDSHAKRLGLGSSAASDVFAIFPGTFIDQRGNRIFLDTELHEELLDAFTDNYSIFGGSAADELMPTKGFQFADAHCMQSSLVLALFEYDFAMAGAMSHGFKPVKDKHGRLKVVSVDELANSELTADYEVTKLDGKPAGQRLKELMQEIDFGVYRPVLGMGTSENARIIIPTVRPNEMRDTVRFNRRIPLHYRLAVLSATPRELLNNSKQTFQLALKRTGTAHEAIRLVLSFGCVSRFQHFDYSKEGSWWETVEEFGSYIDQATLVCALCGGEFAEDERRRPRGDNFSIWFACLTGEPNSRSKNRRLQEKLLQAAEELFPLRNPRDVMESAIEGAISAGAAGGQICECDTDNRKILGGDHGFAKSGLGSGLNYEQTIKTTFRDLPDTAIVYEVPDELKRWTLPAGKPINADNKRLLDKDTNILTVLAANRLAIFIPDSMNPMFHCNQRGVKDGNLQAQFIAPLIGSEGKLIAMIQIGFPLRNEMDRESMGLWLGYIQKVATVLERALEIEEREATQNITTTGNILMQREPPSQRFPEHELEEYLEAVRQALGANYVHLRARDVEVAERRYRLIAAQGPLAERHRVARPVLSENEGSIRQAIKYKESFTNNKEETHTLYAGVDQPTVSVAPEIAEWEHSTRSIQSAAIFRIMHAGDIVGALVIDSYSEYFFTERRKRLARLAAEKAQAVIAKREADFIRQQQVNRERWLMAASLLSVKTLHDVVGPLGNIQGFVDLLRKALGDKELCLDLIAKIERNKNSAVKLLRDRHSHVDYLESVAVSASELMEGALREMNLTWHGTVEFDLQNSSPRVFSNFWLRSAIANLLDNGVESKTNQLVVHVTVTPRRLPPTVLIIEIENDGEIVTKAEIEHMLIPGHSTKGQNHLGLGMTLAEIGIRCVKGEFQLIPRTGGGLIARIELPLFNVNDQG